MLFQLLTKDNRSLGQSFGEESTFPMTFDQHQGFLHMLGSSSQREPPRRKCVTKRHSQNPQMIKSWTSFMFTGLLLSIETSEAVLDNKTSPKAAGARVQTAVPVKTVIKASDWLLASTEAAATANRVVAANSCCLDANQCSQHLNILVKYLHGL